MLRRSPGFTLVAVLTLALGIGATTAIFSVVDAVLLKPLDYAGAERLVAVFTTEGKGATSRTPPPRRTTWTGRSRAARSWQMTAATPWSPTLTGGDAPVKLAGLKATPGLFDLLGARPLLGRVYHDAEGVDPGRVVVLGYGLWQRVFGGDPGVVGRSVTLDGEPHTVVGVMPRGFAFPPFWATDAEMWTPLVFTPEEAGRRGSSYLRVFARLAPGATVDGARQEMAAVARRLAERYPEADGEIGSKVEALREPVVGAVRPALLVLVAAAGLLLLLACANVANLLLGRASAREREHAVRAAIGAGRGRLVRQWLTESLILALLGGVAGFGLALLGLRSLVAVAGGEIPRLTGARPDAAVFAFALALSALTAVVFGVGPAMRAAGADPAGPLRGRTGGSVRGSRARRALAGVQVALSLVLLIGAGLLIKSFVRLSQVEPGFRAEELYTLRVSLGASPNGAPERQAPFFRSLLSRVEALPGVRGAAVVNHLPIAGDVWSGAFASPTSLVDADSPPRTVMRVVSPGYFRAMGVPLRGGRDFDDRDGADAPPVVIVNQAFARLYWPDRSPVGERLRDAHPAPDAPWLTVVGVVGDVRQESLSAPAAPEIYYPYGQNPFGWYSDAALVVRHDRAWAGARSLARQVWALDGSVPAFDGRSMPEVLSAQLRWRRVQAILLCLFAATALVLATVGLYGVLGYLVAQRTREFGVRMALGADRPEVVKLVLREGLLLAAVGTALGLGAAWLLSRFLSAVLYGVRPADPTVFGATAVLVAGFALLACWLPARRATRVDPMIALRGD